MDLWIRSQDKKYLIKVNLVGVRGLDYHFGAGFEFIGDDGCTLGRYPKEVRAMEILDEIQKLLTGASRIILQPKTMVDDKKEKLAAKEAANDICCIPAEFDYSVLNQSVVVYEMPKE